jgi:hypothetical protein
MREMIFGRRTQYQRGADFERKTRDHLIHDLGASYVVRAAGSRGIADLVAFFPAEGAVVNSRTFTSDDNAEEHYRMFSVALPIVWLVQCKRDGRISDEDRELLCSLTAATGTVPYLAWPRQEGRGVVVEMEQIPVDPYTPASEIRRA